jgi:threonine/homoserine/homoserine lactone efflux protein
MSSRLLLVFAVTEFFLSLAPGPAVLLVISQGMRDGFKASLKGIIGILTGNAIYFALSALGLGALLIASATLFQILKWVGAAYLVFIGLRMLLAKKHGEGASRNTITHERSMKLFSEGMITQLCNPKAIVFFSALLPQFVSPGGRVVEQFMILGIISIVVEFPVLLFYGWAADRGSRLIVKERFSSLPDRIAGGFLICAGGSLAAMRKL